MIALIKVQVIQFIYERLFKMDTEKPYSQTLMHSWEGGQLRALRMFYLDGH